MPGMVLDARETKIPALVGLPIHSGKTVSNLVYQMAVTAMEKNKAKERV